MPADRTPVASSPSGSSSHNLLSRPKQILTLERGRACLVCRARKIKCDALIPGCTPCLKSAVAKKEDVSLVICDYDAEEKRRRPVGGGKVHALESKIAELEKRIEDLTSSKAKTTATAYPLPPISSSASNLSPSTASGASPVTAPEAPGSTSSRPSISTANIISFDHAPEHLIDVSIHNPNSELPPPIDPNVYFARSHFVERHIMPLPEPLIHPSSHLVHPSWPKTLPSPMLVHRLVDVYFTKIHVTSGMINRARFLASLQLPPTHAQFPITPLLHAIIATASSMVSDDYWLGEERYWSVHETPSDWHARVAKNSLEAAWISDQNPLQIAQTAVMVCFLAYSAARFGETWLAISMAIRLIVPLGLNHLRNEPPLPPDRQHLKTNMLGPTNDPDELYERSATLWFAIVCDKMGSASTGWAANLDDNDITTLLPTRGAPYPKSDLNSSPLSIHNPGFLVDHPPILVDSLALFFKSINLLGRVVTWLQRSLLGLGLRNGPISNDMAFIQAPEGTTDPRQLQAFVKLEEMVLEFQKNVPREYQNLYQYPNPDSRMYLVFAVPHAATILLHEPFCSIQEGDVSMTQCLTAAKAILNSIFTLYSSSFEIGLLVPFTNFVWAVAGRTLVRELAIKILRNVDPEGQQKLRSDVSMILSAMRAYKSGLGASTSKALEMLLANPEACLPNQDLKHHALGFGPVGKELRKRSGAAWGSTASNSIDGMGSVGAIPGINPLELGVEGHRFQEMLDSVDFESLVDFSGVDNVGKLS